MTFRSRYKLYPLLFLLGMVIMLGIFCGVSLVKVLLNDTLTGHVLAAKILIYCFFIIEFLYIRLFMTDCKRIEANEKKLTFINPVFPFSRKSLSWSEFDYYIIVTEHTRYDIYDAIWLVKDKRLKKHISGLYIKNFPEIIEGMRVPYKGHPEIKDSKVFSCRFLSAEVPEVKQDSGC